ncbi:MAG TPA: hypothetical protein VFF73_39420, partial [Planctomycetota bacterium]|nr:hypothetical protein [Planctomycetota bacterium]
MLRTDDLLLAHLVLRRSPKARLAVRAALKRRDAPSAPAPDDPRGAAARRLMKAKLLSASDLVAMTELIAAARRRCGGCGRDIVAFPGSRDRRVRCARCGARSMVAAWTGSGPAPAPTRRIPKPAAPPADHPPKIGPYAIESVIAK